MLISCCYQARCTAQLRNKLSSRLSKQREAFQSALVGSGEQPVVLRISVAGASAATADDLHLPHTRYRQ